MNKNKFFELCISSSWIVAIVCTIFASCIVNAKDGYAATIMANSTFALTKKQEALLVVKANNGDVKAMVRLAMYYDFVSHNYEKAIFWLRKDAQFGGAKAQYNLGVRLLATSNQNDHEEAVYWLKLASRNGEPLAAEVLESLEKREPSVPQKQIEPDAKMEPSVLSH